MIGTSTPEYILIRICISALRLVAPLSVIFSGVLIFQKPQNHTYRVLEAVFIAESAFYLLVYLPRKYYLQATATHPTTLSPKERHELFKQCHDNISDPGHYLSKWFLDAPISEIKRENLKEFFRWSFLNKGEFDPEDEVELEGYVDDFEDVLGRRLERGRGDAKCLSLTIRPVDMLHRPLVWYMIVFGIDNFTHMRMIYNSFQYHRTSILRFPTTFPPRPPTLLGSRSPVKTLSYWHRPHTSKTRLPVLFIHGIGIGLLPYVDFLIDINRKNDLDADDGDIGIIALELLPVSFRITEAQLTRGEMCSQIQQILAKHGWKKFVLVTHSYGSVICKHMLQTPQLAKQITSILLIDPISFLLHLPDVAYNFTYRKPTHANEHQLYYFASKDMMVSHTLSRRFFWFENIMWKHDLDTKHRPVTVALAGRDLIVDTRTVREYLIREELDERGGTATGKWNGRDGEWRGKDGLDVLWFKDADHAQVFDRKDDKAKLVRVVKDYCGRSEPDISGIQNGRLDEDLDLIDVRVE